MQAESNLRVVFLGAEFSVLRVLLKHSNVVGIYVRLVQRRKIRFRTLLMKIPPLRRLVRRRANSGQILKPKWHRILSEYNIEDDLNLAGISKVNCVGITDQRLAKFLKDTRPDAVIVANFGEIIPPDLLRIPRLGFINFHPSLLPAYRGPDPIYHILNNDEQNSGATWHQMTEKIDAGDILTQAEFAVPEDRTPANLLEHSIKTGNMLLPDLLKRLRKGTLEPVAQDESVAHRHPAPTEAEKQAFYLKAHGKK